MAQQYGQHAAPQKPHTARTVVGVSLVVALIVGGLVGVYLFSRQNGSMTQSTSLPPVAATQGANANEQAQVQGQVPEDATPAVTPTTVEVMMVGDVLMHDELVDSGARGDGTYDYGFLFDHITDHLAAADLKMLNQETVMGEPERGYHLYMGAGGPIMNTPTALADTEAAYGFNLILKATNHTYDLHYSGLGHELDYWKAAHPEIPVLGVDNPNKAEGDDSQDWVDNVYVGDYNGMRIGILNYTGGTNEVVNYETDYGFLSFLSEDKIRSDVQKARDAGAEMLIACPHWGTEYITDPSGSEQEMYYSKLFCDLGVDVILGCHPHVLQPVQLLQNAEGHKTVCYYSMGDFVCAGGMRTDALIGGVARFTLSRAEDGTCSVSAASLAPTVICYTVGPNMSAFPLKEWSYELAAQSARPDLTPDYAYAFLSGVFGDTFNTDSGVVTLDMNSEPRMV